MFVMKINHNDGQPSGPRLKWTFPQKTASVPFNWVRQVPFTDSDYVILRENKLCHFPECLVGQDLNHYTL